MIQKFIQYIQYEKNYSAHTVLSYQNDLMQFCEFLNIPPESLDPSTLTSIEVQQWVLHLSTNNYNSRTIARKVSSLSSFWQFLLHQGLVKKNIIRTVITPKSSKGFPVFYKEKDLDAIFSNFEKRENCNEDFECVRDRLIINLLYQTGMRVSELTMLSDKSIDWGLKQLKVLGKGSKFRIIPISDSLLIEIKEYLKLRELIPDNNQEQTLLRRKKGLSMSRNDIYNIVRDNMSQVSTLKKQSPHVLRHTFATTLLNNGADINSIKELLGHSNLSTTEIYSHISFYELNKVYKQAHPRAVKKGG